MLDNTFTKISEILFAYIQEEVYVCREGLCKHKSSFHFHGMIQLV